MRAASGKTASPRVSAFRPGQPSRIQTVPAGIRGVTLAAASNAPSALSIRIASPSVMPRAFASGGDSQSSGAFSLAANVGRARAWS